MPVRSSEVKTDEKQDQENRFPLFAVLPEAPKPLKTKVRRDNRPWTWEETWALIEGVRQVYRPDQTRMKWAKVRQQQPLLRSRTRVDLKDKWRNLEKFGFVPKMPKG